MIKIKSFVHLVPHIYIITIVPSISPPPPPVLTEQVKPREIFQDSYLNKLDIVKDYKNNTIIYI